MNIDYSEIENDPRVDVVSDERSTGDGVWVYLAIGYCWAEDPGVHSIHYWEGERQKEFFYGFPYADK